jgi:flagella basal body P-ring formation protein FlgA
MKSSRQTNFPGLRRTLFAMACWSVAGAFALSSRSETAANASAVETPSASAPAAPPATHVLTENDVVDLITQKLQNDFVQDEGKLELQLTQPWNAPTVPDEPLTLKVLELPSVGVTPTFIIRFQLYDQDKSLGIWQTSVRAHVWRDIWVANSDLQRGTLVADADVKSERRDVLLLHQSLAEISRQDTSSELAQPVPAGTVLLDRMIRPRTLIHRGQITNALVESGGLSVTTKVEALQDGAAGQIIHIRNVSSRRDLTGKVVSDRTILINL